MKTPGTKSPCEQCQEKLAELGTAALKSDIELQEHVGNCEECFSFLEALGDLDLALGALPEHTPSEELVARTLARVASAPQSERQIRATRPLPTLPSMDAIQRALRQMMKSRTRRFALATGATLALALMLTLKSQTEKNFSARVAESAPEYSRVGQSIAGGSPQNVFSDANNDDATVRYDVFGSSRHAADSQAETNVGLAAKNEESKNQKPTEFTPEPALEEDSANELPPPPPAAPVPAQPSDAGALAPGASAELRLRGGVNAPVDGTDYPVVQQSDPETAQNAQKAASGVGGAGVGVGAARQESNRRLDAAPKEKAAVARPAAKKPLPDRAAVQDAFSVESELEATGNTVADDQDRPAKGVLEPGRTPWVYGESQAEGAKKRESGAAARSHSSVDSRTKQLAYPTLGKPDELPSQDSEKRQRVAATNSPGSGESSASEERDEQAAAPSFVGAYSPEDFLAPDSEPRVRINPEAPSPFIAMANSHADGDARVANKYAELLNQLKDEAKSKDEAFVDSLQQQDSKKSLAGKLDPSQTYYRPSKNPTTEIVPGRYTQDAAATAALAKEQRQKVAPHEAQSVAKLLPPAPPPVEPTGYWANTYLPGDTTIRRLQTVLRGANRSQLEQLLGQTPDLHERSKQDKQPFDVPDNSALGMHMRGDVLSVDGPTRMILQVGLQGTEKSTGRRPAMNLGVVLDLTDVTDQKVLTEMQQLAMTLNDAKDVGDRFQLVVAGKPGGVAVQPDDFRRGPLSITFQHLLKSEPLAGETLALPEAYDRALAAVAGTDDAKSPLGSSAVVVITPRALTESGTALSDLAHRYAVQGVSTSVVGVGTIPTVTALEELALSGQGNRYLLATGSDPAPVIKQELARVTRSIAKAVRLRIRLAPGVKFYGILGSHKLEEPQAQRVREMEQSIDKRLSKSLGIASDRGKDEEGIQIVIPAYYAGDSHVILLDVEVPGPGPVADAHIRYKDLVNTKNAIATATFSLTSGHVRRTPLEENVVRNALAFEMSDALAHAGATLLQGDVATARRQIEEQLARLNQLPQVAPSLTADATVAHNRAILEDARTLLAAQSINNPLVNRYVANSMTIAARKTITTHPFGEDNQ